MYRKKEKHMQEVYAAWGTTREEHMARMLALVDSLNAEVDEEEVASAASRAASRRAKPACRRAVAPKPTTLFSRYALGNSTKLVDRLKQRAANDKESLVARMAAERKLKRLDTIETENVGMEKECLNDSRSFTLIIGDGKPTRPRRGKAKSVLGQRTRSSKGRRRR